jgi:hypothetical protein
MAGTHPIITASAVLPSDEQAGVASQLARLDALCSELEAVAPDPTTARPLLEAAHGIALSLFSDAACHPNGNGGRLVAWYREQHARISSLATRHGLPSNVLGWTPR